ncbi:MAG: choline-sulfatase [Chloroflexota bacterium]
MTQKPNFLFIQADQLSARALPTYGNSIAQTPHINRLAEQGVVFEQAYCNYPLCGPSRLSMMSGLLPSNAGAYDNGAEFAASLPTFAHYLRLNGYQTCLAGKMHFIGPDQLHGFEQRLTTDIYPSDFNWTANWEASPDGDDGERLLAAAGEVNGVKQAGIYERTVQLAYDDEVAFVANRKLHDLARSDDKRPFCLFVSFTHPHDPFAMPRRYWDRYDHDEIDMPAIGRLPREALDPHSQRLHDHIGVPEANMTGAEVRMARHGYYSAISYIDDKVGELVETLARAGFAENTVVIFLSDHGEALGERGLWFKRSFFDCALQVPLIFSAPWLFEAGRCAENVSLVDLFPSVLDIADPEQGLEMVVTGMDGRSLRPFLHDPKTKQPEPIYAEMMGDALVAPAIAVIENRFKYIHCETDPPQLYDRANDLNEMNNLAGMGGYANIESRFAALVEANWNLEELKQRVRLSQLRRRLVDQANAIGQTPSWDYDQAVPGAAQYFRASAANPSASNYNSKFEVRARPDSEQANKRIYP